MPALWEFLCCVDNPANMLLSDSLRRRFCWWQRRCCYSSFPSRHRTSAVGIPLTGVSRAPSMAAGICTLHPCGVRVCRLSSESRIHSLHRLHGYHDDSELTRRGIFRSCSRRPGSAPPGAAGGRWGRAGGAVAAWSAADPGSPSTALTLQEIRQRIVNARRCDEFGKFPLDTKRSTAAIPPWETPGPESYRTTLRRSGSQDPTFCHSTPPNTRHPSPCPVSLSWSRPAGRSRPTGRFSELGIPGSSPSSPQPGGEAGTMGPGPRRSRVSGDHDTPPTRNANDQPS